MSRNAMPLLLALLLSRGVPAAGVDANVRDAAGNPLADAVVYAVPAAGIAEQRTTRKVAIEQVDREFVPYVSVVQAGTTVTFPNRDPILHHVYSFSPAKVFEIKLYTGRSPSQILFDTPGIVTLGCNIHDWMIGYILVAPTPYFAKTDAAGVARLRDVPGGSHELRAWHPQQRAAAAAQTMTLEGQSVAAARFEIDIAPRKARYKPPLDRNRY